MAALETSSLGGRLSEQAGSLHLCSDQTSYILSFMFYIKNIQSKIFKIYWCGEFDFSKHFYMSYYNYQMVDVWAENINLTLDAQFSIKRSLQLLLFY